MGFSVFPTVDLDLRVPSSVSELMKFELASPSSIEFDGEDEQSCVEKIINFAEGAGILGRLRSKSENGCVSTSKCGRPSYLYEVEGGLNGLKVICLQSVP